MKNGFIRAAAAFPEIKIADCQFNKTTIINTIDSLDPDCAVVVFPELCITGSTCGDLFLQPVLLKNAQQAVCAIVERSLAFDGIIIVGVPVSAEGKIYNCAAVIQKGLLLALVPKQEESSKYFASGSETHETIKYCGNEVPFGKFVFTCSDIDSYRFCVQVGEDVFDTENVGLIVINPAAFEQTVTSSEYKKLFLRAKSKQHSCAIIHACAGLGESTTDNVFSGHSMIVENGKLLCESEPFTDRIIYADIDTDILLFEQRKKKIKAKQNYAKINFSYTHRELNLIRHYPKSPFLPSDNKEKRFEDILKIQSHGLAQRLKATGTKAVLGLSGGLDSALALLVVVRAYEILGYDRNQLHCVTMPCFGTTSRTLTNAKQLAFAFGCALHEIDISNTVKSHLEDIKHDGSHDVTFENAQARERTQVLMDLSNTLGAIVIGTGDLSELALGWATFNGDHMSMYGVNCSVPKTLVRHLVNYEALRIGGNAGKVLLDILDTPVSPELLPPKDGVISQKTEDLVGPYELHDFFLYYLVRYGFAPSKIYRIAKSAFKGIYDDAVIKKWLVVFVRRFFNQQFKRSCLPDGPKVGSVNLSPRGGWRMPSDVSSQMWLSDLENI